MSRILVIKKETCPSCDGEKVKKLRRYTCQKCRAYLTKREDAEDAHLPERQIICEACGATAESVIWEVACECQGEGTVQSQASLAEALADPELQIVILKAIGPTLASLLDIPEQTILSTNGAKAQVAVHAKLPGTT